MAPSRKTYLGKKKNHNFVVKVCVPHASASTYRFKPFQDFSADIVENILDRLSSADRIRFGATCKKNLSFVTSNPTTNHPPHRYNFRRIDRTIKHQHPHRYEFRRIDRIPWMAEFRCLRSCSMDPSFDFRLFEPLHRRGRPQYATYEIHDPKGEDLCSGMNATLKASKKGWFLCLWPKQVDEQAGLTSFLLFSPFNKRIIKLPDLDHNLGKNDFDRQTCLATFSSDPTSPDCVYFFLSRYGIPGKDCISTLHQRRGKWQTKAFYMLTELSSVSSVVYHEGCFYCLSTNCYLAAYDVLRQSWRVVMASSDEYLPVQYHILVCEGKLLLALAEMPLWSGYDMEKLLCGLFEFSSSTRTWVPRTSVGNHALFLGDPTSFSVPVSSSLSSCDNNIADRMYFYPTILAQDRPIYYSFKDGRCHAPKEGGYWSSTGSERRGIWIEPLSPSELASSISSFGFPNARLLVSIKFI